MDERKAYILKMAIIYMSANLDDANDEFSADDDMVEEKTGLVEVNQVKGQPVTEQEIRRLMAELPA